MKMVTATILAFVWMIAIFLIGFIVIANLTANATANASGSLIGSAATNWTNFVTFIWVAISLLALTPLIMVILVFAGLFGAITGRSQ